MKILTERGSSSRREEDCFGMSYRNFATSVQSRHRAQIDCRDGQGEGLRTQTKTASLTRLFFSVGTSQAALERKPADSTTLEHN